MKDKNQCLLDVLTIPADFEDGIIYSDPGFNTHKSAKNQTTKGLYDTLFGVFERNWSAIKAYESLKDPKNDIVLEMGCADMPLFESFKVMRMFPNYIGVDIRKDYLSAAAPRNRKDVLAICADLTKPLPIKDESISAIAIDEVIEHIPQDGNLALFREAYRILKPGGKIFLATPVNTRDREFHNTKDEESLGHIFFWNTEDLEEELMKIGFTSMDKKWGYSISSKIKIGEIKKSLHPEVNKFIEDISDMYGGPVARALALSAKDVVNGGCRFTITK